MARKPKNPDIGEIKCPFTGEIAPVRKDCNGKLYYVGKAGMIKPNLPEGQNWMLDNASIWTGGVRPVPVTETPAANESDFEPEKMHVPVNESVPVKDKQVIESPLTKISRFIIG
ncbi:hypothetical protein [Shewanella atlantica]|uniref:Uncharacterized protein n=1 Tax=Shewanella atlantica TaxID=271099 RepID=A0A3S0IE65_9GAMM|nr:hypothetical protein [Shewanella atlantica]RTR33517.1 hypothetical protein EKG39_07280 [Shewanella atlantica]